MNLTKKSVVLRGIRPIMFDRYAGDNDTQLTPEKKMYYGADGKTVVIPSQNILGMLGSNFFDCATKRKYGKARETKTNAVQGFLDITPVRIPIMCDGKAIVFQEFGKDGFYIDESTARIKKSANQFVPNFKIRPVLDLPWSLEFDIELYPNDEITMKDVQDLFELGGLYIGIGTWRGRYGKMVIDKWE